MSTIAAAYDQWADQYDTNQNRTRDLEAQALRDMLAEEGKLGAVLEIGCGTGKNTGWLADRSSQGLGIDFSPQMLARAQAKSWPSHVGFQQADITQPWDFAPAAAFDLVTFSLVLEHIEDLRFVFRQAAARLRPGGLVYVGELHPFKQYVGSQARFDTVAGERVAVPVFQHHVSEFWAAAQAASLKLISLHEHFDPTDPATPPAPPRLLTLLFQKPGVR